jgi:hypothetical protein
MSVSACNCKLTLYACFVRWVVAHVGRKALTDDIPKSCWLKLILNILENTVYAVVFQRSPVVQLLNV